MASKLALKEVFENRDIVSIIVNFLPKNTKRMELHALSGAFKASVHRDVHISRRCVDPGALIVLAGPDLITLTIDRDVAMPEDERGCDYTETVSNRMIRALLGGSWEGLALPQESTCFSLGRTSPSRTPPKSAARRAGYE